MSWNPSTVLMVPLDNGYGLNIGEAMMTPEAEPYRVTPKSPDIVWAGDPGVPQQISVTDEDGNVTTVPNPEWSANSQAFDTVFLCFPDEETAKACLPELWSGDDA